VKSGAGTLVLTGNNSFTGPATISAGTLSLGDGTGTTGLITGNIANSAALTFALVVFGLMIACLTVPWYFWSSTFTQKASNVVSGTGVTTTATVILNSTTIMYDLIGTRTGSQLSGSVATVQSYTNLQSNTNPSIFSTFKLSQAFVLIALILSFALAVVLAVFLLDPIRNKAIFALGMTLTRAILLVAGLLLVASVIIAFLGFLGISEAFKRDQSGCTEGPCRTFSSSVTSNYGSSSKLEEWGPQAGWYVVLSSIPVALILLVVVFVNKFPLPIDSEASSGEAL
jgi:autotransporter-associated beta strand protein